MKDYHDRPGAITIDKGVPMPGTRYASGRPPIYPFKEMNVGDSFFLPGQNTYKFSAHSNHARRHGGKFSVRATTESGVKGVRVWRIA